MTMNLNDKKAVVEQLSAVVKQSISAAIADYRGLTAGEMDALRVEARNAGVQMGVYRNTLSRRAIVDTDFACMEEALVGPCVLIFSQDEPGAPARLLQNFSKENDKIEVKGLALDGQLLGPDQLKAVASLPSRDEALAQLLSVMKAPITKFVRTLNEPVAQVVRVIAAVKDKEQ